MATTRQTQANRANAQRSTGPVTEAGKQASSQNATRHGLLSGTVVLRSESKERWEELLASLVREFQPSTPNELILVETMAAARWRMVRVGTLQTITLEIETEELDPEEGSDNVLATMAFGKSADHSQSLHLLQRYETALDRQYSRALNNLRKCRADKTLHRPTVLESPEPETKTQPQPAQPAGPPQGTMAKKFLPQRIEANSPTSRPPSSKVVGPAALAALRFRSCLNREYRILRLRKTFRRTRDRKMYGAHHPLSAEQSRQARLARAL